jgi:hypothetical protein
MLCDCFCLQFNPNLYNCGKVCLSLLGTWAGGQGESWDAQASSAFQVSRGQQQGPGAGLRAKQGWVWGTVQP